VGITVNYTQLDVNTAINDIIAAKYAATFFQLQMDPTAWQEANFVLTEAATFNVFHQPDETVRTWSRRSRPGSEAEADDGHGGAERVRRRPGLVQPVVPRRGQLRRRTPTPTSPSRATTPIRTSGTSSRRPDQS
jgi:peptide/nickel transport system substrate-binding protein